jgi:hypothetical protein
MVRRILSIFILFMITFSGVSGESFEVHNESNEYEIYVSIEFDSHSASGLECGSTECSSDEDCCVGSCGCPAPVLMNFSSSFLNPGSSISKKNSWFYFQKYLSPSIDLALKPPVFS